MPDIDIPFNYDPVDNKETTASYTVPAGKYAIVTATLTVSAVCSSSGVANSAISPMFGSDSNSAVVELKLLSGTTLTKNLTPPTATASNASGATGELFVTDTSTAELLQDGVVVAKVQCGASGYIDDQNASAGVIPILSVTGIAEVNWSIAEYNSIS